MKTRNDAYNILLENGWTIYEIMEAFCEEKFPRIIIDDYIYRPRHLVYIHPFNQLKKEDFDDPKD